MDIKNFWEVVEARLDRDKAKKFMFAGNAVFTLRNADNGARITFKVMRPRGVKAAKYPANLYFVSYKYNEDTTDGLGYMPIGYVMAGEPAYRMTMKQAQKLSSDKRYKPAVAEAFEKGSKVFNWYLTGLFNGTLPETLEVYHAGRCGRCGKRLTVPYSIEVGYGPECIDLMGELK